MMSDTTKIQYTVTKTDQDLIEILELQTANRPENLSPEEIESQGFVSARHDLDVLRQMHNEYPHIIAKNEEGKVIGYALCMVRSASDLVPVLSGMFDVVDKVVYQGKSLKDDWNYFTMGQVCIAKDYRGMGVFGKLFEQMKVTMSPHFDSIVTLISPRNTRSLRAHEKVGFCVIHEYTASGVDWVAVLWDWSPPGETASSG